MESKSDIFLSIGERRNNGTLSGDELKRELYRLGLTALEEGDFVTALNAYMEVGDQKKVREMGEVCLRKGWYADGQKAFSFLGDRDGLFRTIKLAERDGSITMMRDALAGYIGIDTSKRIFDSFREWVRGKNVDCPSYSLELWNVVNMAYHLKGKHDIGIGIARGGLLSAYIFGLFGLPIKLADAHRRGKGATFEWLDELREDDIKGLKIAVFDKDVVSGRTTRRALQEIQRYDPQSVDLVLNHNPVTGPCGFGTHVSRISPGYKKIYFPLNFNYQKFDKAFSMLEMKLGGKDE